MDDSFKNTLKNVYSHKKCINNFKEMSNINKFLNVPSLKIYTTSKLFNYSAGLKNRHSWTQQIAEQKHLMYHVEFSRVSIISQSYRTEREKRQ